MTSTFKPEPATPDLSVVVPTRNAERTIEACLRSIRDQQETEVEIIVVDNHSDDLTQDISRRYADRFIVAGPERSVQRNIGLNSATAPAVAFIDADMVLTPHVCAEAIEALTSQVSGVVIPEKSFGEGFFARCRALEKRLYLGDPDVEAARVFKTETVQAVGGYREDLVAGEDWDLSDRIETTGHPLTRTEATILHDDGRISIRTTFKKKIYYGYTFARYVQTRSTGGKRKLYRPKLVSSLGLMVRNPLVGAGLVVLKAVEASGLAVGACIGWRSSRKHG